MEKFRPNSYYPSIHDINYDGLYNQKIRCLMFDLDNTLALIDEGVPPQKVIDLMKKLNERFDTYIISNNSQKRIAKFCSNFDSRFVAFALKPLSKGFKTIEKMGNYRRDEMCIIGDQLLTDVLGGKRFGCHTILVDPLGKKDLKVTSLNRLIERKLMKRMTKKGIWKRGEYYE